MQLDAQLVGGVVHIGGHAPHMNQALAVVDAQHGLGISHVNRK